MRYSIAFAVALLAIVALSAGSAYAGCGKKVATVGELQSYDAGTKALTIDVTQTSQKSQSDKTVQLTLTPDSKTMGGREIEELVGQQLSVVSEHGKVDYVIPLLASN
jgi:hypothetical protein